MNIFFLSIYQGILIVVQLICENQNFNILDVDNGRYVLIPNSLFKFYNSLIHLYTSHFKPEIDYFVTKILSSSGKSYM